MFLSRIVQNSKWLDLKDLKSQVYNKSLAIQKPNGCIKRSSCQINWVHAPQSVQLLCNSSNSNCHHTNPYWEYCDSTLTQNCLKYLKYGRMFYFAERQWVSDTVRNQFSFSQNWLDWRIKHITLFFSFILFRFYILNALMLLDQSGPVCSTTNVTFCAKFLQLCKNPTHDVNGSMNNLIFRWH